MIYVICVFACLVVGYLFGNIQTSYILGKLQGIDIREHGSGNAGTTNTFRTLGKKAGIIVFFVDVLKVAIPGFAVQLIFNNFWPDRVFLFVAVSGFGAILGHNFPFYMGFKGGKGIACTAGVILTFLDPVMIVLGLVTFFGLFLIFRYVSLGSICLVTVFAIEYTVSCLAGRYPFDLDDSSSRLAMIESICVICFMSAMAIYRHRANIKRLINHEEKKMF